MARRFPSVLSALVPLALVTSALATGAIGCGGEIDAREAAYPQTIGYDAPQTAVAAGDVPEARPQLAEQAYGNEAYARSGSLPAPPPQADGREVEVGADGQQGAAGGDYYAETDPSALSDFHGALDSYGTWADDSTYGTVWTPSTSAVGSDFAPYVSAGHWAYDDEYTWVSDYSWGWAPFHYGRWVYIGGRGWSWVPGRVYSGAWVSWRTGYDDWGYVGWAPMPPSWYWYGGVAYGLAVVPTAAFVFCPSYGLFTPRVSGYIVAGPQVAVVAAHTRPFVAASPTVVGGAGGRVIAHPSVGPTPQSLHIAQAQVVHATSNAASNPGLARAQAFARPSTAMPLGAQAPAHAIHASSFASAGSPRAPSSIASRPSAPPSHLPSQSLGSAFVGRSYGAGSQGYAQHAMPHYAPSPSYAPRYASPSAPSSPPSYAPPHYANPSPSFSHPGFAHPGFASGGGAPSFHVPSHVSGAPSGGSSSSHSSSGSAPAPHVSSGGFRGGGGFHGGGGFRGGGGRR